MAKNRGDGMSTPHYPWYGYINRILDKRVKNKTQKESRAVAAALEAADPETRAIIQSAFIDRSKTLRGAAADLHFSYGTVKNRSEAFRLDVARRLGLLE